MEITGVEKYRQTQLQVGEPLNTVAHAHAMGHGLFEVFLCMAVSIQQSMMPKAQR